MPDKLYEGARTIDGCRVTVDGALLDMAYDVATLTTDGIEWSYEGDGPAQLALGLLVDHLGDPKRAKALADPFMRRVVANFNNDWEMRSADLDRAIANITDERETGL